MKLLRPTLILVFSITGCGGGGGAKPDGGTGAGGGNVAGTGPYLPLTVGNSWTYQVTDTDGEVSTKIQTVVKEETVGGGGPSSAATAFRLVTGNKVNDPNGDVSWQGIVDGRVVRYRELTVGEGKGKVKGEQYWDPPRLRVDENDDRVAAGATWLEPPYAEFEIDIDTLPDGGTSGDGGTTYVPDGGATSQTGISDSWAVVSPSDTVKVPAGTFTDALVVRRIGDTGSTSKTFWFVRGIGKVKESGVNDKTEELTTYHVVGN